MSPEQRSGIRFEVDPRPVPPDREPPEGRWKPSCKVQDHLWKIEADAGYISLVCVDPCSDEKKATYEPNGVGPGCEMSSEWLAGEWGPFKLEWIDDSTPSGPWGPAEYGGWFQPVEESR